MSKNRGLVLAACIALTGCQNYLTVPNDPRFAPTLPDFEEPIVAGTKGSLYAEGSSLSLYQDIKAFRVGDIITVKLKESTAATKDASTKFKKEYTASTKSPTIFNSIPEFNVPGIIPLQNNKKNQLAIGNVENAGDFKGSGETDQNNSLTGDITVTVYQVLPNKNLAIRGEKWITLNQGSEYIRLTGYVRPEDISPDNMILSNRIANAQITYSGTGALADANTAGWFSRFFNSPIWPF